MKTKIFLLSLIIFYFIFSIYIAHNSLDPDHGWHLKMGELILKAGIPKSDPFSYTMSSYSFIDHEWLSNIFLFLIDKYLGNFFLSLLFTIVLFITLIIRLPKEKKDLIISLIVLLLILNTILLIFGIRLQVLGWFFLSILLNFEQKNDNFYLKNGKWFLPLLMLIWVNMHGSFALGLLLIFIKTGILIFCQTKKKCQIILIGIIAFLATLINPYYLNIYKEVFNLASDSFLKQNILEWRNIVYFESFNLLVLIAFLFIDFLESKRQHFNLRQNLFNKICVLLFGFLAINSIRHIPFFLIFIIPFFYHSLSSFVEKFRRKKITWTKFCQLKPILIIFLIIINLISLYQIQKTALIFKELNFYPKKAINFLLTQPALIKNGEIFSSHGWGGYLISHLPKKKVFLDGRMNSWRDHYFVGEDEYIFSNYLKILKGDLELDPYIQKYNIKLILWPNVKEKEKNLAQLIFETLLKEKNKLSFNQKLKQLNWTKIYQDETAIIYSKPMTH